MSDQIWTPSWVGEILLKEANLCPQMSILEPSIGDGMLAQVIQDTMDGGSLTGVEIDCTLAKNTSARLGINVFCQDFLQFWTGSYDRIIASPPFHQEMDVRHVSHMIELLNPKGRVVSTMNARKFYTSNSIRMITFKQLLERVGAKVFDLPHDCFGQFGGNVDGICVVIDAI